MRVPSSPDPRQCLLLSVIVIIATFVGVKWCLVVLVRISLVTHVEHLFMCLLTPVYLLWRNVYSDPLPIFKLGYFSFLLLLFYS